MKTMLQFQSFTFLNADTTGHVNSTSTILFCTGIPRIDLYKSIHRPIMSGNPKKCIVGLQHPLLISLCSLRKSAMMRMTAMADSPP